MASAIEVYDLGTEGLIRCRPEEWSAGLERAVKGELNLKALTEMARRFCEDRFSVRRSAEELKQILNGQRA